MSKDKLALYDLKQRVKDSITEALEDGYFEDTEASDLIFEIIDSCMPVYNYTILDVARSELWLAVEEPEIYGFNGEHTAINAIVGNLFEELRAVAWEHYNKVKGDNDGN